MAVPHFEHERSVMVDVGALFEIVGEGRPSVSAPLEATPSLPFYGRRPTGRFAAGVGGPSS